MFTPYVNKDGKLIIPILVNPDGTEYTLQNDSVVLVDDVNGEEINLMVN